MTRIAAIATALMLLLALAPWPYEYYMLLRVLVFAAGIYCGIHFWSDSRGLSIALFLCAVLFNPVMPVHLTREIWMVLNVGCAVVFALAASRSNRRFLIDVARTIENPAKPD
ncbi:hypothetical protein J5N58_01175 [Rhizobium cremeum]|uniref:DUF6804 family protein n=1 Tax=Rhizobium cremeum TaxID=2813827 RepID=UPI001FD2A1EC|nr:DUF6804 family protein [Rhizobium cremeum]MCJ7993208.1 hypothetical protein [Rhizobium cremeum]MCJ7998273.1 hypothetical protein [Rhizobium cremeum]